MNIRQIFLVLKREYITRIRSKGFIIATILIPLGFIIFIGAGAGIAMYNSSGNYTIGVVDQTGNIYPRLQKMNETRYKDLTSLSEDSLRKILNAKKIAGYLVINNQVLSKNKNPVFYLRGSGGLKLQKSISDELGTAIRQEKIARAHVSQRVKQIYSQHIHLDLKTIDHRGQTTETHTGFLAILGVVMGVIIFITVIGYGGLITRSVIEEKTSRIIEIIASSVSPIELLLGKMMGVGALALTQLIIWMATFIAIGAVTGPLAGILMSTGAGQLSAITSAISIPSIATSTIIYFVIFYLFGYLIYSSLFAAIGSAVDSQTDTQQYIFPVIIPIMIGYFIMFQAMSSPDSTLAVVGSLIPFCAPIVMITRIAITDVPFLQILSSIVLMAITFAGTMWLSAKIYSVGILSYGQSASFSDLMKWVRQG